MGGDWSCGRDSWIHDHFSKSGLRKQYHRLGRCSRESAGEARTHLNLGQAYHDAKRLPDAIREYEQALKLKPDMYVAYSNMAAIYLDRMELDKAEEMLLKVTSLSPNFTGGFINLGVLYTRKQEPDKALVALNSALEIDRGSFMAHFNKGVALTQLRAERGSLAVMYCGDDLGDGPAFEAVAELRAAGIPGLAVCSGSQEVTGLADLADLVVDGPDGVVSLLAALATAMARP